VVQDSGSAVGTASTVNFADNLSVQFSTGIATVVGAAGTDNIITDKLNVIGVGTFQNNITVGSGITLAHYGDIFATGIATVGGLTVNGDLSISGDITYDEITGRNLNVSGIATVGFITSSNAFYTGVVTATTFSGNLIGGVTGDVVGDVTGTASKSTTSALSDESSDTTCFPTFATAASGDQALKTGTNLTFNSNTGDLAFTSATISDHIAVGSAVTASESGLNVVGVVTASNFVGNGANLTTLNASELGSGTLPNARFPATLPPASGTNLTNLPAANLTGTLPAIDGSALTGVGNTANVRTGILDVAGIATFRSSTLVGSGITLSPDGDGFYTGIITATSFVGDGSNLTGLTGTTINNNATSRIITGSGTANTLNAKANLTFDNTSFLVGSGVTISKDGHGFFSGIATVGRQIVGISTNNLVPFLFNNYSDLPNASDYHGQFAHVHVAGKAFYAHAAAWYQLVNVGSELTVGLGTEKYNVGILTATTIKVGSGVTISSDGDSFATGVSTATKFVGDLSNAVTSRWVLGASGSSHYTFAGPGVTTGAQDPTIYLARGQTYEFDNQSGGSHPFAIRASDGGSNLTVAQGVINNAAASGVIRFEIPFDASNTLVYQCTSHSSMLGNIVVYPSI